MTCWCAAERMHVREVTICYGMPEPRRSHFCRLDRAALNRRVSLPEGKNMNAGIVYWVPK